MSKKKKRAKRNENKVHNNSVPAPQKIPAMIIWDGVKLSVKKQTHAIVKGRVCTDSVYIYVCVCVCKILTFVKQCSIHRSRAMYILWEEKDK